MHLITRAQSLHNQLISSLGLRPESFPAGGKAVSVKPENRPSLKLYVCHIGRLEDVETFLYRLSERDQMAL